MFYVTLQQQLCGKHDVWHNFQDEKYFQKKIYNFVTLAQLTKYSRNTTKQSTKSMHTAASCTYTYHLLAA